MLALTTAARAASAASTARVAWTAGDGRSSNGMPPRGAVPRGVGRSARHVATRSRAGATVVRSTQSSPTLPRRSPRCSAVAEDGGDDTDEKTNRRVRRRVRRLPSKEAVGRRVDDTSASASEKKVPFAAAAAASGAAASYGGSTRGRPTAHPTDEEDDEGDDDDEAQVMFDLRELYGDGHDPADAVFDDLVVGLDDDDGSWDEEEEEEINVIDFIGSTANPLAADPPGHKSGYVAIIGRPNAGKSTLLNQLVGQKLSIVTYKPQTTRHRILGIVSEPDYQMVLLDTPGVMKEEFNKLDELMLKSVRNAMANADVMLVIVDGTRDPVGSFEGLIPENWKNPAPLGVIVNKCDLLEVEEIREIKSYFESVPGVEKVFPVSALAGVGHQAVQKWCVQLLPEGPTLYPKDAVSEHPERFFIAEIIREKIFLQYSQEVPYSTQVWVQSHKERDGVKKDLILAKVFVERKSQMGIIIGAGGKALKELSTAARLDIEKFLGRPVFLDIGVKVKDGWRSDDAMLEDLGLDDPNRLEAPMLGPAPDITA